jgi:hypothetical protein
MKKILSEKPQKSISGNTASGVSSSPYKNSTTTTSNNSANENRNGSSQPSDDSILKKNSTVSEGNEFTETNNNNNISSGNIEKGPANFYEGRKENTIKDPDVRRNINSGNQETISVTASQESLRSSGALVKNENNKKRNKQPVIEPAQTDAGPSSAALNKKVPQKRTMQASGTIEIESAELVTDGATDSISIVTKDQRDLTDSRIIQETDPVSEDASITVDSVNRSIPIIDSATVKTDSIEKDIVATPEKVANQDKKILKPKGLIIGLAGGPEWNQVRGQKLTRAGFDFGVVTGYRFNSKLSIETGIGIAKKYYYSSGKYFNLNMPGKEIVSLEGSSRIIEIPLKLKYNFYNKKRSSFFSSAGFMSYLLTNEKNDYILLVNGAQMNMTNEYSERSRYFASALDLSIGYEFFIDPVTSFRIEPYVQIPLKGIGVGSMQVMSSGLHAAFTRVLSAKKQRAR